MSLQVKIHSQINAIPASEWNALLVDNNPFLRHEFLHALEQFECVGHQFGWLACHIAIYENNHLIAVLPLYQKYNSYGEFVFDNNWAQAWQQSGLAYYPKLVSAIPFAPVSGQRLLAIPEREAELFPLLLQTAQQFALKIKASGFHCLFPLKAQHQWLSQQTQVLTRTDCQFHWYNHDYQQFDDFLAKLTRKKRKNIVQERKRVTKAGVTLRQLDGYSANKQDWANFSHFYDHTFLEKMGTPTLNQGFFEAVARQLPDQVLLVLADLDGVCIAGSLMFRSDSRLYGRHWGCSKEIDSLHFEACYYQGIEYAIEHQLQVFEPGAQGEHKMARGFLPTLTQSSHWMTANPFQSSIEKFVAHEKAAIEKYIEELQARSPYKDS